MSDENVATAKVEQSYSLPPQKTPYGIIALCVVVVLGIFAFIQYDVETQRESQKVYKHLCVALQGTTEAQPENAKTKVATFQCVTPERTYTYTDDLGDFKADYLEKMRPHCRNNGGEMVSRDNLIIGQYELCFVDGLLVSGPVT